MSQAELAPRWQAFLSDAQKRVRRWQQAGGTRHLDPTDRVGAGGSGLRVPVGSQCLVTMKAQAPVLAEVVGFSNDRAFLMPAGDVHGLSSGATVEPAPAYVAVPRLGERRQKDRVFGEGCCVCRWETAVGSRGGRAGYNPMDYLGPIQEVSSVPMDRKPINAMDRAPVRESLDTGIRCDQCLADGGPWPASGAVCRVRCRQERVAGHDGALHPGRRDRGGTDRRARPRGQGVHRGHSGARRPCRSVVVAAPGDAPPLLRMQGAAYATAIAESFRDKGKHVLLLMDSLTRYAMAQREIALAIGEPPATKGYPPSCFSKLPQLVERSGNGLHGVGLNHGVLHGVDRG
jgi:flagellum-specific ATP synthase